jgi:hypothetical protein
LTPHIRGTSVGVDMSLEWFHFFITACWCWLGYHMLWSTYWTLVHLNYFLLICSWLKKNWSQQIFFFVILVFELGALSLLGRLSTTLALPCAALQQIFFKPAVTVLLVWELESNSHKTVCHRMEGMTILLCWDSFMLQFFKPDL